MSLQALKATCMSVFQKEKEPGDDFTNPEDSRKLTVWVCVWRRHSTLGGSRESREARTDGGWKYRVATSGVSGRFSPKCD